MLARFEKKNGRNPVKIGLVLFSFLLYTYLFFLLFNYTDDKATVLSLLPVITISLFFGLRAGLIGTVIIICTNGYYYHLFGLPYADLVVENIPGELGSIALASALGYLHDLYYKSKEQLKIIEKEISERKKAETELFQIQNAFQVEQSGDEKNRKFTTKEIEGLNFAHKIYREIADNAADIIYTINLEGYFTYVNKMGLERTNFSLQELLNIRYSDLVITEYRIKAKRYYLHQYLKKESSTYFEFPFRTKDGSVKWFGQNATLIVENGKITGFSFIARDITERKMMEDEIKKSKEMLHSITYMANDAIISVDNNFNIIQWNRAAERMYQYPESEMLGKSLTLVVPPFERASLEEIIKKDHPTEGIDFSKPMDRLGYKKDGSVFPVEISIAEWKRDNKRFFTHIIRDITERKAAEKKIKQSEKEYRELFANAHEPILLIRPESEIIIEANERACKVYGYEHSEFVGMSLKEISKDVSRGEEKISETLSKGYFINFETIQYNKEGKELYFEVNASVIEYNGEQVILSLNRDITDRVLAERSLQDYKNKLEKLVEDRTEKLAEVNLRLYNEVQKLTEADIKIQNQVEFFRTLINTIPIPVFVKDKNNVYSECNKAFLDFFGIAREDVIGASRINLTPFETGKKLNRENVYETNIVDKEGKIHEVILYQANLLKKDNTNEGWVGIMLDITEQKRMQEETKKALAAEKELSALRARFVSTTSHEFRTPLTSIQASAELLLRYFPKWNEEKKISVISRIQNSAEYMNGLITNVLTLNRSESGRLTFNPQIIEIVSLCNTIIEEIKLSTKPEHRIEFNYSENEITGNFDGILIRQFLTNLLSNAVKYSPDGGVIKLILTKNDAEVVFEVKDNGIGISREDQQNLFEPFFRGANISNIPGTGLGLSILKKAVELHKGKLEFYSEINSGTTFKISIPV